jgi:hypothetical protein
MGWSGSSDGSRSGGGSVMPHPITVTSSGYARWVGRLGWPAP